MENGMRTGDSVGPSARADRSVVCLPPPAQIAPSITRAFHAVGWRLDALRPHAVAPTSVARSSNAEGAAGLIVVSGLLDADIESMLPLLRRSQTAWIAVLDRDDLKRPMVRDLVAENCYDFLTLPLELERLRFCLGHLSGMATLIRSRQQDRPPAAGSTSPATKRAGTPNLILGQSAAVASLRGDIAKLAGSEYPLLIQGESGTGKELASRAIHEASARRDAPFVAVNCASLSPSLIHAELFGYERGAFTGATRQHKGHLEAAHGGTILLDEIGDLSLDLQLLLLRFLDQGTLQRVGGCKTIAVDARVIAATHVDLERSVREGRFRQDLYYRLHVLSLNLPPLRERDDDAEVLARQFLERFSDSPDTIRPLAPCARLAIRTHRWPGNVRELINRVRRALVMSEGGPITAQDLGLAATSEAFGPLLRRTDVRDDAERALISKALEGSDGNAARAASLIGVSRATFYRMMERHGIVPPRTRSTVANAAANDGVVRRSSMLTPVPPPGVGQTRDPRFRFPRDAG
jgi:DNA-binding NtrC family response regulator